MKRKLCHEIMACLPAGRKQLRPEFLREKEARLIATVTEQAWARGFDTHDGEPPDHQLIPINTSVLFEAVHLGQQMSQETAEKVERLANETAGHLVTRRSNTAPATKAQT